MLPLGGRLCEGVAAKAARIFSLNTLVDKGVYVSFKRVSHDGIRELCLLSPFRARRPLHAPRLDLFAGEEMERLVCLARQMRAHVRIEAPARRQSVETVLHNR